MNKYTLFGINITIADYDALVYKFITESFTTFCCVNKYYLNTAYSDETYREQINKFDVTHIDGIGLYYALRFLSSFRFYIPKINGSDLYIKIIKELESINMSLYILGDSQKVLNKSIKYLEKSFPKLDIRGYHHGYIDNEDKNIVDEIMRTNPDVLFVGLGIKKQEDWVNKWKNSFPNTRIIAVGGGLRVISGDRSRGPLILQRLGLEWFFRLLSEPKNVWKRYLIGIPIFIFRVIKEKFRQHD